MTTDLLKTLIDKIAEVHDFNLKNEMFYTCINLVKAFEKDLDELHKKLKVEERISKSRLEDCKLIFKVSSNGKNRRRSQITG